MHFDAPTVAHESNLVSVKTHSSHDYSLHGTQAINMYTLTALFPYVGFMVAGFHGDQADEDAADKAGEGYTIIN